MSEEDDHGTKRKKSAFFDVQPVRKKQKLQLDNVATSTHAFQKKQHRKNKSEEQNEGKKPKRVFPFGNYNRYYDIRYRDVKKDPRLDLIIKNSNYDFRGKDCLDVGCNVGLFTLQIGLKLSQFDVNLFIIS